MGLILWAFKNPRYSTAGVAQPQIPHAFVFYWHVFHIIFELAPRTSWLRIFLFTPFDHLHIFLEMSQNFGLNNLYYIIIFIIYF
jgi:hypothetical protein